MGGKSDGPDLPDMSDILGVAAQQRQWSREDLESQLRANRPTQITPTGTSTWQQDGDQWTQTISLPANVQAALEAQQALGLGRSELAGEMLGDVTGQLEAPLWDPLGTNQVGTAEDARNAAEEAIYGRATSRLDPYWEQAQEQRYSQLWNQGLRPGDEAWDTAMGNLGRARTDAYQTAMNEAIMGGGREAERSFGMDMARRQQAITEALRQRTQGLGEMNMLLGGQSVGTPTFPQYSRAGLAQTPDLLGAQQQATQNEIDRYNSSQMASQGLWSGIGGLASTFAPMVPWGSIGSGALNLFGF